ADESIVVTLVFCSVSDPRRGLSEVRRVLESGWARLVVEHVRARGAIAFNHAAYHHAHDRASGRQLSLESQHRTNGDRGRIQDRVEAQSHLVRDAVHRVTYGEVR